MSVTISGSGQIVKQVVTTTAQYSGSPYFTTSSTSYVSTGLAVTITPSSSTSKVYISVSGSGSVNGSGYCAFTIYRGGTNLATGTSPAAFTMLNAASDCSMAITDSPATTSATTYTVYMAQNATSGSLGAAPSFIAGGVLTITAFEISGS